ncbi:MAG: aspartate/glutamate racemase family protein [Acidimicrobiia bacterium]|nr:aspartate/glutamate racemase family protein [Acidimicrobiia bacterium]
MLEPHARILVLVPFPLSDEQLALRERQLDVAPLPDGVEVHFKPTKAAPANYVSHHDYVLADMSMLESGLQAQADGYHAVCIDTVSDSAVSALRSVLDIPVVGPGRCMYAIASMLGRRFGIVTMWKQWFPLYERVLADIGLADRCAGIRSIDVTPDNRNLLAGKDHALPLLLEAAKALVEQDGADVICLGSTTMHEAHAHLQENLDVPVINPGPVSYFIAEALVALGLTHSRAAYPQPLVPKPHVVQAMLDAAAAAEESGHR